MIETIREIMIVVMCLAITGFAIAVTIWIVGEIKDQKRNRKHND